MDAKAKGKPKDNQEAKTNCGYCGYAVKDMKEQASTLPGDVLMVTSFISYVGGFTKQYRTELLDKKWIPFLCKLSKPIPMSVAYVGANVLSLLNDDAIIAAWNNEGLPSDAMSTENATILTHSLSATLFVLTKYGAIHKWCQVRVCEKVTIRGDF